LAIAFGIGCRASNKKPEPKNDQPGADAGHSEESNRPTPEQSNGSDDTGQSPNSQEQTDQQSENQNSGDAELQSNSAGYRAPRAFANRPAGSVSQVQMRNVDFHIDDTAILRIKSLRGAIAAKDKKRPPAFDDKHSFMLRIDTGTVGISTASLGDIMNNYVFAYPHAPIRKIVISAEGDKIKLKGSVHKLVDIHIEISGSLNPTPEGKIRLHPSSIKADGVPVKRLMHVFGVDLAKLVKPGQARGVEINDDDLIIDPNLIIPAPEIQGRLTAVHIEGDEIVQQYGGDGKGRAIRRLFPYDSKALNYMYFSGGTIRFGKLTMTNADMQIVDAHPKDPFDFSIDHYNRQLVAGYSKNTPRYGLVVFMPDYYQVR